MRVLLYKALRFQPSFTRDKQDQNIDNKGGVFMEKDSSAIQNVLEKETTRRSFLKGVGVATGAAVAAAAVGKIKPAAAAKEAPTA